jgi:hypothetical protein
LQDARDGEHRALQTRAPREKYAERESDGDGRNDCRRDEREMLGREREHLAPVSL